MQRERSEPVLCGCGRAKRAMVGTEPNASPLPQSSRRRLPIWPANLTNPTREAGASCRPKAALDRSETASSL